MSYISKNLLPNETVILYTKKHPIIFFIPVLCTIISLLAMYYLSNNQILVNFWWLPWVITLLLWSYCALEYLTSEYAVTNERIVLREGFFVKHESDLRLHTVSQINILQDPIAQLFNYGTISLNAFGAYDNFFYVANANAFKQKVNEQLYAKGQT